MKMNSYKEIKRILFCFIIVFGLFIKLGFNLYAGPDLYYKETTKKTYSKTRN